MASFAFLDLDEADLTRALARCEGPEDSPRAIGQGNSYAAVIHEMNGNVEFWTLGNSLMDALSHYASLPSKRSYSARRSLNVVRQLAQSFVSLVNAPRLVPAERGNHVLVSAQLELAANLLAWMLIYPHAGQHWVLSQEEAKQIGRRAFAGDSFASIIKKVQSIGEYVLRNSPKTGADVQQWTIKARNLQERRNEIIHAAWSDFTPTGETVAVRLLGRGEPRLAKTPVTELDKLADDIDAAIKEIAPILQAISFPRNYPP